MGNFCSKPERPDNRENRLQPAHGQRASQDFAANRGIKYGQPVPPELVGMRAQGGVRSPEASASVPERVVDLEKIDPQSREYEQGSSSLRPTAISGKAAGTDQIQNPPFPQRSDADPVTAKASAKKDAVDSSKSPLVSQSQPLRLPEGNLPERTTPEREPPEKPNYEIICGVRSAANIPPEVLAMYREVNGKIAQNNTRFKDLQSGHLENSKQEMWQTAEKALKCVEEGQPKEALLLGVGNGLDTPLEKFAERFTRVRVVDVDRKSIENAIRRLPPKLQEKITPVVADLTGIDGDLCKSLLEYISNPDSPRQFFDLATRKIENIEREIAKRPLDLGTGKHAFVSLHLVLSQLGIIPIRFIHNVGISKFGEDFLTNSDEEANNFLKALERLIGTLQRNLFQFIKNSVTPQGTVHLADTYARQLQPHDREYMLDPQIINPAIAEIFQRIKPDTKWIFNQAPSLRFWVVSESLEPKKTAEEQEHLEKRLADRKAEIARDRLRRIEALELDRDFHQSDEANTWRTYINLLSER